MLRVVKIGGNVINDDVKLKGFLKEFASLDGEKILVHGGGREATELSKTLGIETKMIDGRRVTDKETLDVVTMVYAGLINKRIVSILQNFGCDAMGFTGADGGLIPAKRRSPKPVDYGYVGDIIAQDIKSDTILKLTMSGVVPVFCAICHEPGGTLLNCNADSVASAIAQACAMKTDTRLVYCFEKSGVLSDPEDDSSVIPVITGEIFDDFVKTGKITGGMIPKVTNALNAINKGVKEVVICNAEELLLNKGTSIRE